ncbi:hypothetical protein CPB86DRAFT_452805 [Serendipita vermifera]|nr:hypothetical protein CPB86DRAFT_452805 [Serendipita vermifera]
MKQSAAKRIPIEIWEKIISYATASSLLPFTENGELATSLIDTVDLFPKNCKVFMNYGDDSQGTIERLRLVCRSWASNLQRLVNEFTYTDFMHYHFPSQSKGYATYLWAGFSPNCRIRTECTCTVLPWLYQRQMLNGYREEILLRIHSSSLKILVWEVPGLGPPPGILVNLRALSISKGSNSSTFSLQQLLSSAPHLSHICFAITRPNAVVLSEEVQAKSLLWLSLEVDLSAVFSYRPKFMSWTLSRLRTLYITGYIHNGNKPQFERFLSQHSSTITELDISHVDYYVSVTDMFVPVMSLSLWKICPYVETLRGEESMMGDLIQKLGKPVQEIPDVAIPRLTLIVARHFGLWLQYLDEIFLLKKPLNIKRVIHAELWEEREQYQYDRQMETEKTGDARSRLERLLQKVEEMDVSIVDRLEEPLCKYFRRRLESLNRTDR